MPDVEFTSYYGRPVVKASPWENDIPAYLFLGGLAAGSSLLAAGADLTGRPALRRAGRLGALGGITVSFAALVHDLGRPARFVNMLRVAKPTSPMSVGTWILTALRPAAGLAGAAELRDHAAAARRAAAALLATAGPSGRVRGGRARPGGRVLHRGPAGRHRVAAWHEALPRAAVRVRRSRPRRPPAGSA